MVLMNNLVGKRVYNQSSFAPSQGTNDPQGYINREINKPQAPNAPQGTQGIYGGVTSFGNDGQSDTRSGMAQRALQANPQQFKGTPLPTASKPTAVSAIKTGLPQIKISPVGKLKLPFNFKYAQGVLEEKRIADAAVLKLQQKRQAESRAYMSSLREGAEAYDDSQEDMLNDFSGRGVAFSSGYGKEVSDSANKYNQFLGDLNLSESDSANNATSGRATISDSFKAALSKYANQAGYDLDSKAGTYGLKPKAKPKPKAKAKPKPKPKKK